MKKSFKFPVLSACILLAFTGASQPIQPAKNKNETAIQSFGGLTWKQASSNMHDDWYNTKEAKMITDSVLTYQTKAGGWTKNHDYVKGFDQIEWNKIKATGIGATFDNGATLTEMRFLAKMYGKVNDGRYLDAFYKGFNYVLEAQYDNGGWPQFYPIRPGKSVSYNAHITYNDNAMVNILEFLNSVATDNPLFAPLHLSAKMKENAKWSFNKGVDCILKTQIKINGQPAVWCAQHNKETLLPANARAYELASFSGSESAGIMLLLMQIDHPSTEIMAAVKGAKKWFEDYKITGIRVSIETGADGKKNRIVTRDITAPPLWARFYDLQTGKPFFCDRDGIKKATLAEIGYERRNGYSWYTATPQKVLQQYPGWARKWKVN